MPVIVWDAGMPRLRCLLVATFPDAGPWHRMTKLIQAYDSLSPVVNPPRYETRSIGDIISPVRNLSSDICAVVKKTVKNGGRISKLVERAEVFRKSRNVCRETSQ